MYELEFNFIFKFNLRSYQENYLSKSSELKEELASSSKNVSQTSSEDSVSYLNIYYEDLYYTVVKESPLMTAASLLGTIG